MINLVKRLQYTLEIEYNKPICLNISAKKSLLDVIYKGIGYQNITI